MNSTDWIAIYGAVLSTVIALLGYINSKSNFRVKLQNCIECREIDISDGICISVMNHTNHKVVIKTVHVMYPYCKSSIWDRLKGIKYYKRFNNYIGWVSTPLSNYRIKDNLPAVLEAGFSYQVVIPRDKLKRILDDNDNRKLVALVEDSLGRRKYSTTLKVQDMVTKSVKNKLTDSK